MNTLHTPYRLARSLFYVLLVGMQGDTQAVTTCGTPLPIVHVGNAYGTQWMVHTEARFVVTDLVRHKTSNISERSILLDIAGLTMTINGKSAHTRALQIESTDGVLQINGVTYRGMLFINSNADTKLSSVSIVGSLDQPYAALMPLLVQQACDNKRQDQLVLAQQVVDNEDMFSFQAHKKTATFKIKVLLDQLKSDTVWRLSSDTGFMLWGSADQNKKTKIKSADLLISKKNKLLCINNNKFADELLCIAPLSGNASFNGSPYHGVFLVSQHKDQVYLINNVDLEEYVYGVLHTESWPGWPLEIHKVCAIACRSYAIAMAMRANKLKKIYHIKNTNEHQTYSGLHGNKVLRQAVDDTRGVFISYKNRPIVAMYDICCGGIIPAHIGNFNFDNAPYLAREYPCLHCKLSKTYLWETVCALADFEKLVSNAVKKVKNIKSVAVSKKDKAGLVSEVVLKNSGAPVIFSGQKMYSLMKEIKSLCFQAHKQDNNIVIKGRGYGHHIGLCQWGAREMVRDGWNHKRILQFYYPGTDFMRIT